MTKIVLSLVTLFLFVLGIYLIITNKNVEGSYYGEGGWVHNSFNGYLLLILAIGFLIAMIFIFRNKEIKP